MTNRAALVLLLATLLGALACRQSPPPPAPFAYGADHMQNAQHAVLLGDFERAAREYRTLVATEPGNALAYAGLGYAEASRGDLARAIAAYDSAISLGGGSAYLYIQRGRAQLQSGHVDLAVADLTQAIALQPDSGEAYYQRGTAYARAGDQARARADLERARQLRIQAETTRRTDGR